MIHITYTPYGLSAPVTIQLPGAMFGEESGYIAADDINRSLDGTMHSYRAFRKRRKVLKWDFLSNIMVGAPWGSPWGGPFGGGLSIKQTLEDVWNSGQPFTFADDMDPDNQFTAYMMTAPVVKQDFKGIWEGQVEIQEV